MKVKLEGRAQVVIHALHDSDAQECWAAIEESINSKLVITMNVKITKYQVRYLKTKHREGIDLIKKECGELWLPYGKQLDEEVPLVKMSGTVSKVMAAGEQLRDLLEGYGEEEFELATPFYRMWSKRWRQLEDDRNDVIIIFDQKATDRDVQTLYVSDVTNVSLVVCGCDESVQEVKNMILTQESGSFIQTKTLMLPPNGAVALLMGLKEKQKQLDTENIVAEMSIEKASNTVTIISPRIASDDIIKMEKVILSYVGDHRLQSETVTLTDPIIGLILTAPKYRYGDQLNDITKLYNVRAVIPKYPNCELTLIGDQHSIGPVRRSLQQLLEDIGTTIKQVTLPVEYRFAPMFASKDFHLLCTKVREEYGVICSPPMYRRQNVTLRCVLLPPPSQLQLEIVRGSLGNEHVGAIVTASSVHTGGDLPKWLSEAGGPSIQAELEKHIRINGYLRPGDAVCLGRGDLACRKVIHTVLSQWTDEGHYTDELSFAIQNVLTLAQEENIDIIALSAIGAETCGVPEQTCARLTLDVISHFFLQVGPSAKVHTVRCVLETQTLVDAFLSSLHLICPVEEPTPQRSTPLPSATVFESKVSVNGLESLHVFKKYIKPFLAIFKQPSSQPMDCEPQSRPNPSSSSMTDDVVSSAADELVVKLRGPEDQLDHAADKIVSTLEGSSSIKSLSLPPGDCRALERRLQEITQRHYIACSIEAQPTKDGKNIGKVLVLEGTTDSVQKTVMAVEEEIDRYLTSAETVPPEWKPQSKTTELFTVAPGTPEWFHVVNKFKQTLPQARITSVLRIQNTWLWDRYVQHRKRLRLKNSGVVNEIELFHGTSNNDPKLIYEGEDGFDMRYSAQGMWGVANYFAVNASYSHQYAHIINRTTGQKEMFLVKVLTGDSYKCAPIPTLRMPPPKPSSGGPGQLRTKFDTVTGTTKGSQVFMTYDNEKAYPAYLIQYYM